MSKGSQHLEVRRFVMFTDSGWRRSEHVCYLDWMYMEKSGGVGDGWRDGKVEDAIEEVALTEGIMRNLLFVVEL